MPATILKNTRGVVPLVAPVKADGSRYAWALMYEGDKYVAFADDCDDLMVALIRQSYDKADDPERQAMRRNAAVFYQCVVQADLLASRSLEDLSDEQRAVLLGSRDEQPRIASWDGPIPLVLVDQGYEPHTDVPRPVALDLADGVPAIWWIDTEDASSLLRSLHSLGVVRLAQSTIDDDRKD